MVLCVVCVCVCVCVCVECVCGDSQSECVAERVILFVQSELHRVAHLGEGLEGHPEKEQRRMVTKNTHAHTERASERASESESESESE